MGVEKFGVHIDPSVWTRGIRVFEMGGVDYFSETSPGNWIAKIQGTERYTIEVKVHQGDLISSYCNCPYDADPICKHIVATMIVVLDELERRAYAEKHQVNQKMRSTSPFREYFQNFIDEVGATEFNAFIIHYGEQNPEIREEMAKWKARTNNKEE